MKRLTNAKYLYLGAADALRSAHPLVAAEALLRVHDAVEMFQLVVLEAVGASGKFEFMSFWEQVKVKTSKEPPYKDRMGQLNHMRVGFKHKGVLPDLSELRDVAEIVSRFFSEVSREYLQLDFSTLTLAELVDDAEVQQHLRAAGDLIDAENYSEAVIETAKAFYIVVTQHSPRAPWRPQGSDLLDLDFSSQARSRIRATSELANLSGVPDLLHTIEEQFQGLHDRVFQHARLLEMLIWNIDLKRYGKFAQFIPYVDRTGAGEFYVVERAGVRRPTTARDARFCFQFVVDTALVIQRQRQELPDAYGAQRIKTVAGGATLYTINDKHAAAASTLIPEGEELQGLYYWVPGIDACWDVTWKGTKGYVKSTEVIELDSD